MALLRLVQCLFPPPLQLIWPVVVAGLREWIDPRLVNKTIIRSRLSLCLCTDSTLDLGEWRRGVRERRSPMVRFAILMHVAWICLIQFKYTHFFSHINREDDVSKAQYILRINSAHFSSRHSLSPQFSFPATNVSVSAVCSDLNKVEASLPTPQSFSVWDWAASCRTRLSQCLTVTLQCLKCNQFHFPVHSDPQTGSQRHYSYWHSLLGSNSTDRKN